MTGIEAFGLCIGIAISCTGILQALLLLPHRVSKVEEKQKAYEEQHKEDHELIVRIDERVKKIYDDYDER